MREVDEEREARRSRRVSVHAGRVPFAFFVLRAFMIETPHYD